MADLLAGVFSKHDPLAVAVGLPRSQIEALVRLFGSRAITDELTIIARAGSGELVGAMLTEDLTAPHPPDIDRVAPSFAPIGALLESLDEQYRQTHPVQHGTHLHLFMVGVAPSHAGRGIAQSLIRHAVENGGRRGFRAAIAEATGAASQGIFRKLGFSELHAVSYREFLYGGQPVFASIAWHEGTILMETPLV